MADLGEIHGQVEALRDSGALQNLRERDFREVAKQGLTQVKGPPANVLVAAVQQFFEMYDMDNNGTLGLGEFCGFMMHGLQPKPTVNGREITMEDCFKIFAEYDQSNDDQLSVEEIMAIFVHTGPVRPAEDPENDADDGEPFEDAEFPADTSSLGQLALLPVHQVQWARVDYLCPGDAKLFDNIEPNDLAQGMIGNCWLLAAMSSAAEFSGLVESLFLTKAIPVDEDNIGKYHLKLFDGQQWREIIVDDRIPMLNGKPAFSKPQNNELWVMLLEKAVAKLCGTYAKTENGFWNAGWLMFTGCTDQWRFMSDAENMDGVWTKSSMKFSVTTNGGSPVHMGQPESQWPCEQMWQTMKQWDKENYLMGAGTLRAGQASGKVGHSGGESIRTDGIAKQHAYSVLKCIECEADGEQWRMLQLRNPWGNATEWNGRFSDKSDDWEEYPELAEELGFESKDDGMFWMTWEDFVYVFDGIFVNGAPVQTPKRHEMRQAGITPFANAGERYDRNDPASSGKKQKPGFLGMMMRSISHGLRCG